jgi:hypothetical protein
MINSISNRPGHPGYVPPRPSAAPPAAAPSFEDAAARAVVAKRSAVAADGDAVQAGMQLSRAYELAAQRRPGGAAVPQDLLWALTGPGGSSGT